MRSKSVFKASATLISVCGTLAYFYWVHTLPRTPEASPVIRAIGLALVMAALVAIFSRSKVSEHVFNWFWMVFCLVSVLWLAKAPEGGRDPIISCTTFLLMCIFIWRFFTINKHVPGSDKK